MTTIDLVQNTTTINLQLLTHRYYTKGVGDITSLSVENSSFNYNYTSSINPAYQEMTNIKDIVAFVEDRNNIELEQFILPILMLSSNLINDTYELSGPPGTSTYFYDFDSQNRLSISYLEYTESNTFLTPRSILATYDYF